MRAVLDKRRSTRVPSILIRYLFRKRHSSPLSMTMRTTNSRSSSHSCTEVISFIMYRALTNKALGKALAVIIISIVSMRLFRRDGPVYLFPNFLPRRLLEIRRSSLSMSANSTWRGSFASALATTSLSTQKNSAFLQDQLQAILKKCLTAFLVYHQAL